MNKSSNGNGASPEHHVRVLIVGAGFSGIGAAIKLDEAGIDDFVVLEKAETPGGTWRENTYPGCACDVMSSLYSYSFAPNPDWSRIYGTQPEIQQYLLDVAERFDVNRRIEFGTEALDVRWDEDSQRWIVETNRGRYVAQAIIAAAGPLHEPKIPEIPGLEDFEGTVFHSATWDHDHDLGGERVAVVGTGASAVQFIPKIAREVGQMTVFQRTAPWVVRKPDAPGARARSAALFRRLPFTQRLFREGTYHVHELIQIAQRHPRVMQLVQRGIVRWMHSIIRDPELREKVTPDYTLGCKRILPSNTYYRALTRDNVSLVAGGVTEVRANSVIDANGDEHEVDTIIFGTGFHATDPPIADRVRGRDGRTLARGLGRQLRGLSGDDDPRLPERVPDPGPEPRQRPQLGGRRRRGAAALHRRRAEGDGARAGLEHRRPRRGLRRLERPGPGGARRHRLERRRLRFLVSQRRGTQRGDLPVDDDRPAPQDAGLRPRRLRGDAGARDARPSPRSPAAPTATAAIRSGAGTEGRGVSAAPIELRGAVVAVTGGARGIGRATAEAFAARGATVCIGDLDGDAAADAAREIGAGAQPFQLDVSDRDSFAAFLASAEEAAGPLDVLVNNAGIGVLGRFTEESDGESEKTIDVNLKGPMYGMKLALPGMVERGRGHVVNVASAAGKFRAPGLATYVASKHGVVGLTASIQDELRGTGVTATTVMPFVVKTELASGVKIPFEFLAIGPEKVGAAVVAQRRAPPARGLRAALGPPARLRRRADPAMARGPLPPLDRRRPRDHRHRRGRPRRLHRAARAPDGRAARRRARIRARLAEFPASRGPSAPGRPCPRRRSAARPGRRGG